MILIRYTYRCDATGCPSVRHDDIEYDAPPMAIPHPPRDWTVIWQNGTRTIYCRWHTVSIVVTAHPREENPSC